MNGGHKNIITALSVLLAVTTIFGLYQLSEKNYYKNESDSFYYKSIYSASEHINEMDKLLSTVMLAKDSSHNALIIAEIWKRAALAHNSLSNVSYDNSEISAISGYIAQVGSNTGNLLRRSLNRETLSNDDWKQIDELREHISLLSGEINIFNDQESGIIKEALYKSIKEPLPQEAKMTVGKAEISKEDGIEIIKDFLKSRPIADIKYLGTTDRNAAAALPVHNYEVRCDGNDKPTISMSISCKNGYPVWMLDYSEYNDIENKIPQDEAIKLAVIFLNSTGIPSMRLNSYVEYYDSIVASFILYQDQDQIGVNIYPDNIKIKVSLFGGEIIGYEATNYLMYHHERDIPYPKLSLNAARDLISEQFDLKSANLAIIPVPYNESSEILCYEFGGIFEGEMYNIYINADNGRQEKIAVNGNAGFDYAKYK